MSTDELYAELKGDIAAVANPLFDFSEKCLQKRGNFLPHGAYLDASGKVGLFAAAPENDITNSTEALSLLQEGLRASAKEKDLVAIGVAENVTVTPDGEPPTEAIKVLFEHKRGLVVALYLPFKKNFCAATRSAKRSRLSPPEKSMLGLSPLPNTTVERDSQQAALVGSLRAMRSGYPSLPR